MGIPDVWLTGWIFGRSTPLRVFGPSGTSALCRGLERAYAFDVHVPSGTSTKEASARGGGARAARARRRIGLGGGPLRITAFLVDRAARPSGPRLPGRLRASLGRPFRRQRPSRNLVGGTRGAPTSWCTGDRSRRRAPRRSVVLSLEQREQTHRHHSTPEQAGRSSPGPAEARGVLAHRSVLRDGRRPGGADAKDLRRPARSGGGRDGDRGRRYRARDPSAR